MKWARTGSGPVNETAESVALDSEGNSYLSGSFSGKIQFGDELAESSASMATFVAKFDRDGNALWVRSAGSTGKESQGLGIAVTGLPRNRAVYVCGLYDTSFEAGLWQLESR
ncbi:MAG: hypothetical protein HGA45_29745, partial [Chloroflexales bacterium]|nr:hypothetical protein [Chloroflexales bacterium]